MIIDFALPWDSYDWKKFQKLSIAIAQNVFPTCDFQEYLKQGNAQEGIDLIEFDYSDGSKLCAQCKREKTLTKVDIDKIIGDFLKSSHAKTSREFVLITSADLQTKKLQPLILDYKENLKKNNGINFHCWDRNELENHLRKYWGLVFDFFDKQTADRFCHAQLRPSALGNIDPVKDYIPRRIHIPVDEVRHFLTDNRIDLVDIKDYFISDRTVSRKILLLGDAYQGKSSYLKHAAYQLMKHELRIQPLLLEIKKVSKNDIEEALTSEFPQWETITPSDLVIFIDGLDEAPTDSFLRLLKSINLFSKKYPGVSVVLSCRKLFYESYQVPNHLKGFDNYLLYRILPEDKKQYLESRLKSRYEQFVSLTRSRGVDELLDHPFYLVNLVDNFLAKDSIPDSRIGVIDLFISRAFDKSFSRQMQGGKLVDHERHLFKQTVGRFALALQLSEKNALQLEDIQRIFSRQERDLLEHSSLVQVSGEHWSFNNAIFQEHFSAMMLTTVTTSKIIEYATVGINLKKIKIKWLQTIGSLLSILESTNQTRIELIDFIEQDNIEFLFLTERSKFDLQFRETLFKKLLNRCIREDVRPILAPENKIAEFIEDIPDIANLLIDYIKSNASPRIKNVCSRLLRYIPFSAEQKPSALSVLLNEVLLTTDDYYAYQTMRLLSQNKMGSRKEVEALIANTSLLHKHYYRDGVYEYIYTLGLSEDFYWFAIEGIDIHIQHNTGISHAGSEYHLENILLSTNNRRLIAIFFQRMAKKDWLDLYRYRGIAYNSFIERLMKRCTEIFQSDPLIIFQVARYVHFIGRDYLRSEFSEIDRFFETTDSYQLALRILLDHIFHDNDWECGALITDESYDFVLFEFEQGKFDLGLLRNCLTALRVKKKEEQQNQFLQLCIALTGDKIYNNSHSDDAKRYHESELRKKRNDKKYIVSRTAFKKGLIKYFKAFGRKSIPDDQLYIDYTDKLEKIKADSNFIFSMLIGQRRGGKSVYLSTLIKATDDAFYFPYFRAHEILNQGFTDEEEKSFYMPILQEYYNEVMESESFVNCHWTEANQFKHLVKPDLAGQIYQKFKFSTSAENLMKFVWLDDSGIRSFRPHVHESTNTFSKLIIEKLSNTQMLHFKQVIVDNIRTGIVMDNILGTHIGLCVKLNITEAKEDILKLIKENRFSSYDLFDTVKAYLDLGGNIKEVSIIYKDVTAYESWWYGEFSELIAQKYPQIAIASLEHALTTLPDGEARVSVAKILSNLGVMKGFQFLVAHIRLNHKSPYSIQGTTNITGVPTSDALKELEDVMYLVVDPALVNSRSFHDEAPNIIREWLEHFAAKSETDLQQVLQFLARKYEEFKVAGFPLAADLNFYANKYLENFRNSDKTAKTVYQIKEIVETVFS